MSIKVWWNGTDNLVEWYWQFGGMVLTIWWNGTDNLVEWYWQFGGMVLTIQNRITRKVTNRSATLSTTNHVNWPGIKPKPQHQLLLQTERQVGSVEERERPGEKWDTLLFQGRQKEHHFECFQHSLIVLMIEHPNHISTPNPRPALMFLV